MSPRRIGTHLRRGAWKKVGSALIIRDLFVAGDASTAWLLHLHCGIESVVSGPLAVRLQGWDVAGSDHVVVAPVAHRAPPGMSLRVIRRKEPTTTYLSDVPPLVPRLDALVDVLLTRSSQGARDLLDHALQRRWIDANKLATLADHRGGPGRKGQGRLLELFARASTGSRSEAEQVMGALLKHVGGGWVANYAVHGNDGRVLAEIDFAEPRLRLAIEIDGRAFHSDHHSFEKDRARQNMLALRGWTVLRFTWERLINDPEGVLAEIQAAMRQAIVR